MAIPQHIKNLIQSEIKGDLSISNLHGVNLEECLVDPYLEIFDDSCNSGQTIELYVVLEEFPHSNDGYKIVYDLNKEKFGLVLIGKNPKGLFLGYYGSFINTFKGM